MQHTNNIFDQLDPREHCQECGALTLESPSGRLCPHCGSEEASLEEEPRVVPLWSSAGFVAEGIRFHLGDDRSQAA